MKEKISSFLKSFFLKFLTYEQAEKIKSFLAVMIYYSGIARLLQNFTEKGAAILVYHSINNRDVFCDNRLNPEIFEKQIAYLSKNYKIVPLSSLIDRLQKKEMISDNWVVITFDDGYKDNITYALPILKKYNVTGTFYLPLDAVFGNYIFFYDEIQWIIDRTRVKNIKVELNGQMCVFSLENEKRKKDAIVKLVIGIRQKSHKERLDFIKQLYKVCRINISLSEKPCSIYMDEDDIKTLCACNMEIGSHTITHPNLATLPGAKLHEEINMSKLRLEKLTQNSLQAFSYPFGKKTTYNDFVKKLIKNAGYTSAVMTVFGKVNHRSDIYALPRIGVRDSIIRLKVNLMGINI